MDKFIYIYNPIQAEFIIRETKGQDLYRIGKGKKGDVCVRFYDTPMIRFAIDKWCKK